MSQIIIWNYKSNYYRRSFRILESTPWLTLCICILTMHLVFVLNLLHAVKFKWEHWRKAKVAKYLVHNFEINPSNRIKIFGSTRIISSCEHYFLYQIDLMFKGSEYHENNNCLTKVILTTYDATVNQDMHTLTPKLSRILPDRAEGQGVVTLLFQGCLKIWWIW